MIYIGIAVLIGVTVLDVISTIKAINSGNAHEANPIMAKLFSWLPQKLWWLIKLLVVVPIAASLYLGWPIGAILVWGLNVLGVYIVINNYRNAG